MELIEGYGSWSQSFSHCPGWFDVAMFQRSTCCQPIYPQFASLWDIHIVPEPKFISAGKCCTISLNSHYLVIFPKPAQFAGYFNTSQANVSWTYRLPHGIVAQCYEQRPYRSLVINCYQLTPKNMCLRTNLAW